MVTPRSAVALALAAIPASIEATLILPERAHWVVAGSYIFFGLILWLCWSEIRVALKIITKSPERSKLPNDFWVVMAWAVFVFLIATALWIFGVPGAVAQNAPINPSSSVEVQSGNCSAQNSPGATINCSPSSSPSAPGTRNQNKIAVKDAKECPPGYQIIDSSWFHDNGVVFNVPGDAKICIVNSNFNNNDTVFMERK
ncbi:MAG: hypothetical protein JO002_16560 [Burkholderiaceae bacterium]|nr:hypothetical protein [Burkholderiaceae bacterium]